MPILRKFAKDKLKSEPENSVEFIENLPHKYIEENNLHAFILSNLKDFEKLMILTEKFLPHIDNWSTCDSFRPKIFKEHKEELFEKIKIWLKSKDEYTVRFAIGMLKEHFLDENFKEDHLERVAKIKSGKYYIDMMRAWYFSEAIIKQRDPSIKYIEGKILDEFTHNMTIQKCSDSRRIDEATKAYLKTLRK